MSYNRRLEHEIRYFLDFLEDYELEKGTQEKGELLRCFLKTHSYIFKILLLQEDYMIDINDKMDEILKGNQRLARLEGKLDTVIERGIAKCPLNNIKSDKISYVTGIESTKKDIKTLDKWLIDAEDIIIADPYYFSFTNAVYRTKDDYMNKLIEILPNKLKSLEIYHLPGPDSAIKSNVEKYCRAKSIKLQSYPTTRIHDRVWIKNKKDAQIIGTSFGGLGNKIAFIVNLPPDDLEIFKKELHKIKTEYLSGVAVTK